MPELDQTINDLFAQLDTTLNREVALKLLPDLFVDEPGRRARFEREAQLLASLSHTNIAAIHGIHSDGDRYFLDGTRVDGLAKRSNHCERFAQYSQDNKTDQYMAS